MLFTSSLREHSTFCMIQFYSVRGRCFFFFLIFSDESAAQYKGRGIFADLTHNSAVLQRIYFGSEHGNGEADGETGLISKSLDTAVLRGQLLIRNAEDLFKWSVDHLSKEEPLSKRIFSWSLLRTLRKVGDAVQ